jgi:hypothetical protein
LPGEQVIAEALIEEIKTGDAARIPPNVKHWHGASPTVAMTHIAISEQLDGKSVEWMEKVTDAQYNAPLTTIKLVSTVTKNNKEKDLD